MKAKIKTHEDLDVYKSAFDAAMRLFELSKEFPVEERYSLTDQIRRSSRSVCANLAEAWRKRRYKAVFVAKLNDSEAEAAESQVWIRFAVKCGYLETHSMAKIAPFFIRHEITKIISIFHILSIIEGKNCIM